MKFGSFIPKGESVVFPGRIIGDLIEQLDAKSMIEVIANQGESDAIANHPLKEVKFVAPIQLPTKIICVGLNYREHITELGHQFPSEPVIFSKPSSAIIGPGDTIILPGATSHVDYEGEVAIVIGKKGLNIENPKAHIFGYTCFNDVTARDIQRISQDWTRAKGFDTFAPMGPAISTERPKWIMTHLNGKRVQHSSTSDMIFGFEELVKNISRVMTLLQGDIIATGTPFGVGKLKENDKISVEADGIGMLENLVADEKST